MIMIRAPHRSAAKVSCLTRTQSSGVQGAGCRVQQAIRFQIERINNYVGMNPRLEIVSREIEDVQSIKSI